MGQLFANAARAYLSAGIAAGDTTISISSGGALFPVANGTDWFKAVLQDAAGIEIVYVTAHTSGASSFTVTRGQEGTTARSFAAGSVFGLRVTAADTAAFAGKLGDAPSDGKTYGRKDAAWAEVVSSGDLTPAGTVIFYAKNSPPTGYLKANGAVVSRSTYAALFAAIGTTFGAGDGSTTFNVPDLRGQFLRGWVDNGSVDSGRAFGSGQAHAYLNHAHTASGSTDTTGAHTHPLIKDGNSSGVFSVMLATAVRANASAGPPWDNSTNTAGDHSHTLTVTVAASTTGSTETRPVNVALLACIKF